MTPYKKRSLVFTIENRTGYPLPVVKKEVRERVFYVEGFDVFQDGTTGRFVATILARNFEDAKLRASEIASTRVGTFDGDNRILISEVTNLKQG